MLKMHFEKDINLRLLNMNQSIPFGYIYDDETNKTKLEVFILKDCYKKTGYNCMVSSKFIEEDDGNIIGICYISEEFYNNWFYRNKKVVAGIFFHELGHIANGDYKKSMSNIKNQRINASLNGIVDLKETLADAFAVQYVGKEDFIKTLKILIELREIRNDNIKDIAIKELQNRIKFIESINFDN